MSALSMDDILSGGLNALRKDGLLRRLRRIDHISGTKVVIDGKQFTSFGSNDYLGLTENEEIVKAAADALCWGAGATGSRLTTGNFALHEELERAIAAFKHTESAILFSSGYAANVGVISAISEKGDLILSDSLNHASLIDGCRLSRAEVRIYNHCDVGHAHAQLSDRFRFRRLIVVTDGVFSMDGDLAPLPELADLCERKDGWLMVDDAHGTGVYGENGTGTIEHFGLNGRVQIQMGTLSKAVGCAGGFVAGSNVLIEYLRNRARSFVYSTAAPPSVLAASMKSLTIIKERPELRRRLKANIFQMRSGLKDLGLRSVEGDSPIIPLIIGSAERTTLVSQLLEEESVWIPAIRPPSVPPGTSRLRIAVSAAHQESEITLALGAIARAWKASSGMDSPDQ